MVVAGIVPTTEVTLVRVSLTALGELLAMPGFKTLVDVGVVGAGDAGNVPAFSRTSTEFVFFYLFVRDRLIVIIGFVVFGAGTLQLGRSDHMARSLLFYNFFAFRVHRGKSLPSSRSAVTSTRRFKGIEQGRRGNFALHHLFSSRFMSLPFHAGVGSSDQLVRSRRVQISRRPSDGCNFLLVSTKRIGSKHLLRSKHGISLLRRFPRHFTGLVLSRRTRALRAFRH